MPKTAIQRYKSLITRKLLHLTKLPKKREPKKEVPEINPIDIMSSEIQPLVSVIIACYNHGRYLATAIESILILEYPNIEIIVVDDGSTDNTQEVLKEFSEVKNVYQENQGLSAARNTGIANSSGEFLIFLDADDWLLDYAISTNLSYLLWNDQLACVSGAHEKHFMETNEIKVVSEDINEDYYWHLLQGNYIGMHASVMFRRWVFDTFSYDTSLTACEDYDLYLKITREFPVFHHSHKIAAYRIHRKNMSGNTELMLTTALKVLQRQRAGLKTNKELKAYKSGLATFKTYYSS
jgi:glycosyltransferase involved in cell wall biosynthesis